MSTLEFPDNISFADAAMCAVDPLWAILPRGWTSARAAFRRDGDTLTMVRVGALQVEPGTESWPDLGWDQGVWARALGLGFTLVRQEVSTQKVAWDGASVRVELDGARGSVFLENSNGDAACAIPLAPDLMRGRIITDETVGIMLDRMERFAGMQRSVAKRAATLTGHVFHTGEQALTFSSSDRPDLRVAAQVLGTYSQVESTFVWAWANPRFNAKDVVAGTQLRDRAFKFAGAGALWRPVFFSDERFAGSLAMLAASEMGATGVFPPRTDDGNRIYYALLD